MEFNTRGHQEVEIASQITPPIVAHFSTQVGIETTLTSNVTVNDRVINLTSVTGLAVDHHIVLGDATNTRFFVGQVLAINTLAVTVDAPASFAFTTANTKVNFTSVDMRVDGSTTPVVFSLRTGESVATPMTELIVDVTRVLMTCTCDSAVSLDKFGNLTALTNGCVLRIKLADGSYHNIFTAKTNADLRKFAFDWDPSLKTNPAQNIDGFAWRLTFGGEEKMGTVVRATPEVDLEWVVQDNLASGSPDLTTLESVGEGAPVAD
jgi:hypothetical protein